MSSAHIRIALIPLFILGSLSGCKKNPCKDMDCGPYGACEKGVCICEEGYVIGPDGACDQRISNLIQGVYRARVKGCNTGDYDLTIQGSNVFENVLVIVNLGGYTCSTGDEIVVEATISSPTQFKLEPATYCEQYKLNGTGTISDKKITISYDVEYVGSEATGELVTESCQLTLDRL